MASQSTTPPTSRLPGRPVGGRLFERRDVVEAALDAIARGGYESLSMRGVARDIGASLATVQRHFATKDDLWRGAVDDFLDSFERPTHSPEGGRAPLVAVIEQLLSRGGAHPGLISALLADKAPGHRERWEHLADRLRERHGEGLASITALQEQGIVRPVDQRVLQILLNVGIGSMSGAAGALNVLHGIDLNDPKQRSDFAAALADIIGLGLLAR